MPAFYSPAETKTSSKELEKCHAVLLFRDFQIPDKPPSGKAVTITLVLFILTTISVVEAYSERQSAALSLKPLHFQDLSV